MVELTRTSWVTSVDGMLDQGHPGEDVRHVLGSRAHPSRPRRLLLRRLAEVGG